MSSTGSSCNVKLKTSGISTYLLYDIVRISIFEKEEETSLGRLFSHIKNRIFFSNNISTNIRVFGAYLNVTRYV